MDSLRYWTRLTLFLEIAPGEQKVSLPWVPSEHVYGLLQGFPDDENRTGEWQGIVSFYDPDGRRIRYDDFDVGGRSLDFDPFYFVPGTHTIELVLDRPAILPTRWPYVIDVMENKPSLCEFGFEWDICGA